MISKQQRIDIDVELGWDVVSSPLLNAKLQGVGWELNVHIHPGEAPALLRVRNADWNRREAVKIGTAAGAPVFWSCRDGELSILVGDDDEVWDIGFTLPETVLLDLISKVQAAAASL